MTRVEICKHLDKSKGCVGAVVSRLNKATKERPKRVYVTHYVYDDEGGRRYPRAVYALGDLPDKPHPKPNVKANKARYWARKVTLMKANSVFNLGLSRAALMQMRKAIKEQKCNTSSESTQA